MQTGENSITEAFILYHSNSYYIVLLSRVQYKLMTLCSNTTIRFCRDRRKSDQLSELTN